MKVRKAIKSIAAIGVGAIFLGTTMGAAMAADLSQYPSMFIKDGQFNGVLVIGKNADAIDTLGITNIALGLQAAAVTKTTVCSSGSSSTSTVDKGVKISKSSQDFVLGEDINSMDFATLDKADLPTVLGDEIYNDNAGNTDNKNVEVTQELTFVAGAGELGYYFDDDLAKKAAPYLLFPDNVDAYKYVLEFDNAINFDVDDPADDLETTTLKMQGQVYTITEAKFNNTDDGLEKLTLMVGDTSTWMTQGQTITKAVNGVDHTVKMTDVTEGADSCGFEIDGTAVWIDNGDTDTIGGLTIGVIDAKAVHTEAQDGDICKVNFGASELVLEQGEVVVKDGSDIDGSTVSLSVTAGAMSAAEEWDGITIVFRPEDSVYIASGDAWVDPVFGNFKFIFGGLVGGYELVDVKASTSAGTIKFTNSDGKDVSIAFAENTAETGVVFGTGDDADERIYFDNAVNGTCTGTADAEDCKGAKWLLNFGTEAHIVELADLDIAGTTNEVKLKDITYGMTSDNEVYTDTVQSSLDFTGIGTVKVTVNEGTKKVKLYVDPVTDIESEEGSVMTDFGYDSNSVGGGDSIFMEWTDDEGTGSDIYTEVISDADGELKVDTPAGTFAYGPLDFTDTDSDNQLRVTAFGSKVSYDSDANDMMKIELAKAEIEADVFVSPAGAALSVSTGAGSGCQVYETVNKIPSSVNKFDSDVTSATAQNTITVGGPCANAVTSALLGNPSVCYQGFESGKAMLKLVETGDKVALVIAGGTGEDTLRASKILQNYDKYTLTGKQMVATTVSETGLSVAPVTQ